VMFWGTGMGAIGWLIMILNLLALWALVVIAAMALARGIGSNKSTSPSDTDHPIPMRILEERLARGDIDVDEYQARQEALRTKVR
jgi:putative membrane protein